MLDGYNRLIQRLNSVFTKESVNAPLVNAEMQTYGNEVDAQMQQVLAAIAEMHMHTAGGKWLDLYGYTFGITRMRFGAYGSEGDTFYRNRILSTILRPTQNNFAIAKLIYEAFGIGFEVNILDAELYIDDFPDFQKESTVGRYFVQFVNPDTLFHMPEAQIKSTIDEIRYFIEGILNAAGTALIEKGQLTELNEVIHIGEGPSISLHYDYHENIPTNQLIYPDGTHRAGEWQLVVLANAHDITVNGLWRVGSAPLRVGANNLWLEQISIAYKNSNGDVIGRQTYAY
jgi:hypothetical protein